MSLHSNYSLRFSLLLLLTFPFFGFGVYLRAQNTDPSFFSQLYSEEVKPLEAELSLDMKTFLKNKNKEEYQEGRLSYLDPTTNEKRSWEVELRPRGNMRKSISYIPPIMIKFKKDALKKEGLSNFNKLKLVAQYRSGILAEQYVLKEFHAYRLYNQLSPYSFRVQLIRLTLTDLGGKKKPIKYWGFLIEPEEEMAERLNGVIVEREKARTSFLEEKEYKRMCLFEYMIGNTDWAIGNSHNIKFLKVPALDKLVPVPYDFDYAGMVNASYAAPFHTLPIKRVTERLYRGETFSEEDMNEFLPPFEEKHDKLVQLLQSCPYMDSRNKRYTTQYIESFFQECKNKKSMAYALRKVDY
ncbi:MAG: hypothetical protein R2828_06930 [Saprospiraceae bacterium]